VSAEQPPPLQLEALAAHWQLALDAGERALGAAAGTLPVAYLSRHRRELGLERQETARMLSQVARASGVRPATWLSPVRLTTEMLGLPPGTRACVFELDGVLSDSVLVHAGAWGEVFDAFLLQLADVTGRQFVPFDRGADYRAYIDGRSRIEGVRTFLESRGIRLPEGRPDDVPEALTAWGLAKRKGEALARALQQRGVTALTGAGRYLEAAGQAGLGRAVSSASSSTLPMLELASLATLVDVVVDADVITEEQLRTPPAPDVLVCACRRLGVPPEQAVTFTHTPAGVAAGLTAGLNVVGIGDGAEEELLRGFGARRVASSLAALLDRRLVDVDPAARR
jgi:beta-phosphoglucomutase-like phosphatase (HAD superfamily)